MISIGLTSGLGSIAYSVLSVAGSMELTEFEVMPGPRKKRDVPDWRRYRAHKLMIDAIFDRHPPAVIGLGPPSTPDEPIECVIFMRTALLELGKFLKVPVVLFDTDEHVQAGLGARGDTRGNGLKSLIGRHLGRPFGSNERRVILATATAMAGALQVRGLASREVNA